jgi:hypothetical protein
MLISVSLEKLARSWKWLRDDYLVGKESKAGISSDLPRYFILFQNVVTLFNSLFGFLSYFMGRWRVVALERVGAWLEDLRGFGRLSESVFTRSCSCFANCTAL